MVLCVTVNERYKNLLRDMLFSINSDIKALR
jgi:hypothetical protein